MPVGPSQNTNRPFLTQPLVSTSVRPSRRSIRQSGSTVLALKNPQAETTTTLLSPSTLAAHHPVSRDVHDNVVVAGDRPVIIDVVLVSAAGPLVGSMTARHRPLPLLSLFFHHRRRRAIQTVQLHARGVDVTCSGIAE